MRQPADERLGDQAFREGGNALAGAGGLQSHAAFSLYGEDAEEYG
jgi:hypothetical protein